MVNDIVFHLIECGENGTWSTTLNFSSFRGPTLSMSTTQEDELGNKGSDTALITNTVVHTPIFVSLETSYGDITLVLSGLHNGDKAQVFDTSDCSGEPLKEVTSSGESSVNLSYTLRDYGVHNFYAKTVREEKSSDCSTSLPSYDRSKNFVSTWRTSSDGESVTLPLPSGYTYNFTVDWGDGTSPSTVVSYDDQNRIHTYSAAGTYTVSMSGTIQAWSFRNTGDKDKLISIEDLGDVGWLRFWGAFWGCRNLTSVAGGNTSQVVTMANMFNSAVLTDPDTRFWNVSNVGSMINMFAQASAANPDVSKWDTSNLQKTDRMFQNATSATPDISLWNFSLITEMGGMFQGVTLPTAIYSALLNRIEDTAMNDNVSLGGGNSKYDSSAMAARNALVARGWAIADAGLE